MALLATITLKQTACFTRINRQNTNASIKLHVPFIIRIFKLCNFECLSNFFSVSCCVGRALPNRRVAPGGPEKKAPENPLQKVHREIAIMKQQVAALTYDICVVSDRCAAAENQLKFRKLPLVPGSNRWHRKQKHFQKVSVAKAGAHVRAAAGRVI